MPSRSRAALFTLAFVSATAAPAAGHTGTTHAGTPHWLLLGLLVVGLALAALGWRSFARDSPSARLSVAILLGGVGLAIFGSVGLVEIQVAPTDTPGWTRIFPLVNLLAGVAIAAGSFVVGRVYFPRRPRYTFLGILLAAWVSYPSVMPNDGLAHPLGYLLAFAVPVGVGYVLWTDAGPDILAALAGRTQRVAAVVAFVLFGGFFTFSAGTLTVNPDLTAGMAGEGFVTTYRVASPLVYWPAIEFFVPSIPLAGYVSLGTLLLVGLLGGLVALNVGLVARQWAALGEARSPRAMVGAFATSGATACCCCAPALYGAVGAVFGTAATPVYWAFMDPASPVGGIFFAVSVLLLTASALGSVDSEALRCAVPADGPTTEESAASDD